MTSSSDPVGQVDPDLAEAERMVRSGRVDLSDYRTFGAALGVLLREYDARLLRIKAGVDMVTVLAREAASLRAELSRARPVVQAAVAYINQGVEDGEVSAASVGRALTRDSELRAALADAVREAKR